MLEVLIKLFYVGFNLFYRFDEKGNLEVLLFTLQSEMRANNQKPYLPKEGKLISDINKAWDRLEKAEHERELALREELIRYSGQFVKKNPVCFKVTGTAFMVLK